MLHMDKYLQNIPEYVQVYFRLGFAVQALVFVRLHSIFRDVQRPTLDQVYNHFASMDDVKNHLILEFRFHCYYQILHLLFQENKPIKKH